MMKLNQCGLFLAAFIWLNVNVSAKQTDLPNFVYIMVDELGYYEPGFMGGEKIQTPNIDQMANDGIRFTQLLAGSSVCAPTRCTFLTGKHSGHSSVRSNGGGTPLRKDEITIASMLKTKGYATGGFGKWGCGGRDSTGVPEKHGFDVFFGYYDQVHAHTYYPPYLIKNSEEVPFDGNRGMSNGDTYSQYVIHQEAKQFIRANADQPFFAYLPYTPPHGLFDIPDDDPAWKLYAKKDWPEPTKRYAAMVTMLDRQVGEILQLLRELKIDQNTLVIFSGDNGGADYFKSKEFPRGFHEANVHPKTGIEFRGKKGNLYEGGLRIPFVAKWPGKIAPNQTSHFLGYFPDIMPTFAELSGIKTPVGIDGISFAATLLGEENVGHPQGQHEYLYWEIGNWTAIRKGNWRAVKSGQSQPWELYNLDSDPAEQQDLSGSQQTQLNQLVTLAKSAHEPVREGTFHSTDRHERDRRAKFGRHDDANWSSRPKTKKQTVHQMPKSGLIPTANWKIIEFSSENSSNGKFAKNAIDADPKTWWHSHFTNAVAEPPHEMVIDLAEARNVSGLVFLGRQDGSANGCVKDFSFALSLDGNRYGEEIKIQLDRTSKPQTIKCSETSARFLRIRCLSDYSGSNFAAISEIGVLGD
ncbi:sulfatase-like hydrolase/transferase [Rhodopirellula sp.]|nr:sulfatase-like hydrolase/transferase [Rhodopirellula sp.]MDB4678840.1 sulfatase-like hydrolase/transferase [Rhodopirellula sp.]